MKKEEHAPEAVVEPEEKPKDETRASKVASRSLNLGERRALR